MTVTRREFIAFGAGAAAVFALPGGVTDAFAASDAVADAIATFTGGKQPQKGRISLSTPEIAENGNTVPVRFSVESPMTAEDHVKDVLILADGNPRPGVATFHFSPMNGEASAATRIRLAKTQNIIAIARMSDGSLFMDERLVKVTIGGCGG